MKNIHLLPTDKPSILGRFIDTNNLFLRVSNDIPRGENVNIYITSDEEIKDVRPHKGKWHLEKENILNKFPDYLTDLSECKLVIMTTDDDLINDGVQAIDDEFLEWVVNNPSCEFVEIKWVKTPDGIFYHQDNVPYGCYKIITPKEESTFYTKKCKCMIFEPNCFTGMCKNCGGILKEETKPKTMLESLQEYFKNTPKEKVLEDWNESQHLDNEGITVNEFLENQKQETLEEAAEKYSENWEEPNFKAGVIYGVIEGAKWQQKQMYSEEDMIEFADFYYQYKELIKLNNWETIEVSKEDVFKKWIEQLITL